jgi:hypothetical protein
VVHAFTNKAERDSSPAGAVDGLVCMTLDTGNVYVRRGGAWWVLEMPWRSFAPYVWGNLPGSGIGAGIIQSTVARWRQSLGACRVQGYFTADFAPFVNVDARIQVYTPVRCASPGPVGGASVYVNSSGLQSGGLASWEDNSFLGGMGNVGSRVSIKNGGDRVIPFATAKVAAGNTYVIVEMDLSYECDPTTDP